MSLTKSKDNLVVDLYKSTSYTPAFFFHFCIVRLLIRELFSFFKEEILDETDQYIDVHQK